MSKKSIKVNSVLNVLKTGFGIIFPLITFPYVSRVLQPENIGKVNFSSSVVSYFSLIASLGITSYAIRECASVRDDRIKLNKIASEIFSINIFTTIIAYILLAVTIVFFHALDSYRSLIVIQSSAILFATLGTDWLNSAMEDFEFITIRTIIFQLLSLILMFIFVKKPDDFLKYACITVLSSSGANITNIFYRKKYCSVRFTKTMRLRVHLKPILLLFVMILAQNVFNNADITMLGLMKGDFEVGIYSTAYKIKNIITQVTASMLWVVMPRLSQYFSKNDYVKVNSMLKKVLGMMVLIGFPCVVGSIALSAEIIEIVGGAEYALARVPLVILILSFLIDLFGGSFLGNMVCLPGRNERVFLEACCFSTILNIVLNYILIPVGGAVAAAITSGISALVILVWLAVKKNKNIKLDFLFKVCREPLVGSILIYVFCALIKTIHFDLCITTMLSVLGSILIYLLSLIILKNELVMEILPQKQK